MSTVRRCIDTTHLNTPAISCLSIYLYTRYIRSSSSHKPESRYVLTYWGQDNMAANLQTTSWNAFSWMKIIVFLIEFHRYMFSGVRISIWQHWFRWWLGACPATSQRLNQCWCSLLTNKCVTRPQWVKHMLCLYPLVYSGCRRHFINIPSLEILKDDSIPAIASGRCLLFLTSNVNTASERSLVRGWYALG